MSVCMYSNTVKPEIFTCPLFREFRDLGKFAKITGREYGGRDDLLCFYSTVIRPVRLPSVALRRTLVSLPRRLESLQRSVYHLSRRQLYHIADQSRA